jgi:YgiT-type zinc finger domain-containing protein
MNCYKKGCPGKQHEELIVHAVSPGGKGVVVFNHVPALVCDFCGASGFTYNTVEQLERILQGGTEPAGSVPLYDYAQAFPERLRDKLIANRYGTVNMAELPAFKCRFPGHPGVYEQETTVYQRRRNGQLVVVNNVPQLVCNICADILYEEQTLRQLDRLLDSDTAPIGNAPLYEFAQGTEMQPDKELVKAGK